MTNALANGDKEGVLKECNRFFHEAETNAVKEQVNRNINTKKLI